MRTLAPAPARARDRRGVTMIEIMMVVAVAGIMMAFGVSRVTVIKDGAALRAGRQEVSAMLAAARAAALQKGKTSTLTFDGSTAKVTVLSGLNSTQVNVLGPIRLYESVGVTLTALAGSPTTLNFDSRGMLSPVPAAKILRYRIAASAEKADTICVSAAGVILPRGCAL